MYKNAFKHQITDNDGCTMKPNQTYNFLSNSALNDLKSVDTP